MKLRRNSDLSNKLANMSLLCSVLIVCHHFGVVSAHGSGIWWLTALFGQAGGGTGGGLTWIGVPWFFLASGFFIAGHMGEHRWWRTEVVKRLRTLCIPFFFWTVLGILLLTAMDFSQGRMPFFGSIKALAYGIGFCPYRVVNPIASQLWYMRALFALVLVSPLIYRLSSIGWLLASFLIYTIICPFDGAGLCQFFRYGFSVEGLFYFSLGVYLRKNAVVNCFKKPWFGLCALALGIVLLLVDCMFLYKGANLSGYLKWASTPFLLWGCWTLIPTSSWPVWLTSAAFPIYLMHRFFFWPFNGVMRKLFGGGGSASPSIMWLVYLSIGVLCPIAFSIVLKKMFPKFSSVVFGGR